MVKRIVVLFVVVLVFMAGCTTIHSPVQMAVEEEAKLADLLRSDADILIENWLFYSGLIRGALDADEIPLKVIKAMDFMDQIAAKNEKGEELSDFEKGAFLGVRLRACGEVIAQALKQYAPDVLSLIRTVL